MIDDQRYYGRPAMGYVIATDQFLSGWGLADGGRSLFAVAVDSEAQADAVTAAIARRPEMKRPRLVRRLRADGTPQVRLAEGDHLSVRDSGTAAAFYRGAAAWSREEAADV